MMSLEERQVAVTHISDSIRVSTVFLEIDPAEPTRWETLIFGGLHDGEGEQYATLEDARAGHELWVMVAEGKLTPEAIVEMRMVTAS
jgi:hypothetical protein